MHRSSFILFVAMFVAAACGAERPTAPSTGIGGRWTGTLTQGGDRGTTVWDLTAAGPGVSGTWSADFEHARDQKGSVGGTLTGSKASLFLTPSDGLVCDSGITLSGTLTVDGTLSDDRLTGSHLTFTCAGVETGTVDVVRN